ncbi:MAG: HEPN domain-containing protein [bacterium]
MKKRADLVKEWFTKADHDLIAAGSLLKAEEPLNDVIAFHCQQAVEKYLKGYMIHLGLAFTKTHEIGGLIAVIEGKDPEITYLKEGADALTDYAVEIRYPESHLTPSQEEIKAAIEIVQEVQAYVRSKISEAKS